MDYFVKERELDDPDFELPLDEKGCLDIRELVYQELIFKIPRVLLCSPDCQGLCPICGKRKAAGCNCQPADEAAPADARLSKLEAPTLVKCPQCGELKVPHQVCGKCGYYKGVEVVKVSKEA